MLRPGTPSVTLVAAGRRLARKPAPIWAVAYGLDGCSIAVADACGRLFLGNGDGRLRVAGCFDSRIFDVAFAEKSVVVGLEDGRVCIAGEGGRELGRHSAPVRALAKHPVAPVLVSGSEDGQLLSFDLDADGAARRHYASGERAVTCAQFSPDGTRLATGSGDSTTTIWDEHGARVVRLRQHRQRVWSVAFRPDGQQLATTSADGTLCLWHTKTWELEAVIDLRAPEPLAIAYIAPAVTCAGYAPDGAVLFGSLDGAVRRRGPEGGQPLRVGSHSDGVLCLAVDLRGHFLSGSLDGSAIRWTSSSSAPGTDSGRDDLALRPARVRGNPLATRGPVTAGRARS